MMMRVSQFGGTCLFNILPCIAAAHTQITGSARFGSFTNGNCALKTTANLD